MQGKIPFLLIIVCIYIMYTALCDGPEHQSEDYRLVQFNFICPGGGSIQILQFQKKRETIWFNPISKTFVYLFVS